MNIGIDFGSTYSVISDYRKEKGPETLTLSESSPYLPTEVALKGSKYSYGTAAKSQNGKSGVRPFKSFKMLLAEGNTQIKKERGYDEDNTPEKITRIFLDYAIKKALTIKGENKIEYLVIGAPEIWSRKINTIDVRAKLRDICESMPFVDNVEVVSEPAAASAYFAYNFYKSYKKYYEGTILLIDYGGGTLDVTLTQVRTRQDENVGMEIKVLERTGVGENEEGHIGKAGIVYMESVVSRAIRDAGIELTDEELFSDPKFYRAVNEFEEQLQSRTEEIQDIYDQYEDENSEIDEEDDLFTDISYQGEEVLIRYSLMRKVYREIIYDVLDEQLDKMISFMRERDIAFMDRNQDTFKIALVGGFGNFYLVSKQVEEKFGWSYFADKRREGIIYAREDKERAISLGAALLANHVVTIQHTAPYSVGLYLPSYEDGKNRRYSGKYAIEYGTNIKNNEIHYQMTSGSKSIREKILFAGIEYIIISSPNQQNKCLKARLTREMVRTIKSISSEALQEAYVGFSMDSSEVLSFHIEPFGMEPKKIELAKLTDLVNTDKLISMDYLPQK